jgi:hypothetical protein
MGMKSRLTATQVEVQINKLTSNAGLKEQEQELAEWTAEAETLRNLLPSEARMKELRVKTIPSLEKQVGEESAQLETVQQEVEEVSKSTSMKGNRS